MVILSTDPPGKELDRQVGVDRVITSRNLCGVMVSTLARNRLDAKVQTLL